MFDKKLLLYTALAFICFALWSAWQKDFAPDKNAATKSSQQVQLHIKKHDQKAQTKNAAERQADFAVAAQASAQGNNSDLVSPNLAAEAEAIAAAQHIIVTTDVLRATIDTNGGNIVKAELLQYPEELRGTTPVTLLNYDLNKFYVAKSGLRGKDLSDEKAIYRAEKTNYVLTPDAKNIAVKLVWHSPQGLKITKTLTFVRNKYDIAVNYAINNYSHQTVAGQFFAQMEKKTLGAKKGFFTFSTYTGAAVSSPDTPYEKLGFDKLDKTNVDREVKGGWVAFQQRYFLTAWIPEQTKNYHYFSNAADHFYTLGFSDNSVVVKPGAAIDVGAKLYVGPEIADHLTQLAPGLDRTVDYGWLWLISVALFWLLKQVNTIIGNWGWSIIVVTIVIKLLFYKPSEKSYHSMAAMKSVGPKIQALKERYAHDKQRLNQEIMELYRKEKISPLSGCLPMLIQIPFFIALYYVLMGAVELRQAPFMFWIHDLAAKDPFYVLPILMGLSMLLQQKLTPSSPDPAQARIMMIMPVVFTVFFLTFPSGLVLYWLVNNLLSILQQWHINRKLEPSVKHAR